MESQWRPDSGAPAPREDEQGQNHNLDMRRSSVKVVSLGATRSGSSAGEKDERSGSLAQKPGPSGEHADTQLDDADASPHPQFEEVTDRVHPLSDQPLFESSMTDAFGTERDGVCDIGEDAEDAPLQYVVMNAGGVMVNAASSHLSESASAARTSSQDTTMSPSSGMSPDQNDNQAQPHTPGQARLVPHRSASNLERLVATSRLNALSGMTATSIARGDSGNLATNRAASTFVIDDNGADDYSLYPDLDVHRKRSYKPREAPPSASTTALARREPRAASRTHRNIPERGRAMFVETEHDEIVLDLPKAGKSTQTARERNAFVDPLSEAVFRLTEWNMPDEDEQKAEGAANDAGSASAEAMHGQEQMRGRGSSGLSSSGSLVREPSRAGSSRMTFGKAATITSSGSSTDAERSISVEFANSDRGSGIFVVTTSKKRLETSGAGDGRRAESLSVRRTIADFMLLHNALRDAHAGVIVPSLPELGLKARSKYGTMYEQYRRQNFARFLQNVHEHPLLHDSHLFRAFLGEAEQWPAALHGDKAQEQQHENPATSGSAIADASSASDGTNAPLKWAEFKIWQASRSINRGLERVLDRDQTTDDKPKLSSNLLDMDADAMLTAGSVVSFAEQRLRRLRKYIQEISSQIASLQRLSWASAERRLEHRRLVRAMSNSMQALALHEEQGSTFARALSEFGECIALEHDRTLNELNDITSSGGASMSLAEAQLDACLTEFATQSSGAYEIIVQRMHDQEAYEHALDRYTKLRDRAETDPKFQHDPVAQQERRRAAQELAATRSHYEKVSLSANVELKRFREQWRAGITKALHDVMIENLLVHAARLQSWNHLYESWNEIVGQRSGGGGGSGVNDDLAAETHAAVQDK
ncbi:hypothetical protein FVE85_8628 [Porphyridium purpureum]|uniref:PX domain-containing protein n=1 Tax=Porphyridium purpureum TaxID=35688 RepID=A0A5J4YQX3_PORPP|nr:hypothetical protein FVE85_8628 [Porphyridium purpureum]|eukprot:POR6727..scf296_7